ncbi:MAG: antibiotic biosynthesis monooxygenase family protein, partial [Syntrophales bacterium]|nr:antibiotic biosynthesis monooxygenase family protein [Syntrophales bacterium]
NLHGYVQERRMSMIVKIFIQSKSNPAKEKEFKQLLQELRIKAMQAEGFISGETMQSVEDPSVHLTIGTWKSITNWNSWINSPESKAIQDKFSQVLIEPVKMTLYHYE